MKSTFIVSLDFELFWGVQDEASLDGYGKNVLGVWNAVPKMLELFSEFGIHATWATVGFMFAENYEELKKFIPSDKPTYSRQKLLSYNCFECLACDKENEKYFFAPSLIEAISKVEGQEIGSHTFSHYYCDEEGQTIEQFEADMMATLKLAKAKGYELKSFVFPRNQSDLRYVEVLERLGFTSYRSVAENWIHDKIKKGKIRRALRLMDVYLPLTGSNSYIPKQQNGIYNFPGSNMFKPKFAPLAFLEWLKVLRIKRQMKKAAKKGKVYHLWWHPHNLGLNTEFHLKQLRSIFEYRKKLDKKYGMLSLNMQEMATHCQQTKGR